jgi:hexosaminidase
MFPSPYHIGGDEVEKESWRQSAEAQAIREREGLKDEDELQSYFIRRIERFLTSKNRRMIGWDEILQGGLAPNAIVMSWRGEGGGIEAVRMKHSAIMTPTDYARITARIAIASPSESAATSRWRGVQLRTGSRELSVRCTLSVRRRISDQYVATPDRVEYMVFRACWHSRNRCGSPASVRTTSISCAGCLYQLGRLDKQAVHCGFRNPWVEDFYATQITQPSTCIR